MITNNPTLVTNCLQIEAVVRIMVMKGIDDNESLVEVVDSVYHPKTELEQEMYSEAIIHAKQGVLN